ncbi:MAG: hypothetical protein R2911_28320 [Caldilineaceae bacterium]
MDLWRGPVIGGLSLFCEGIWPPNRTIWPGCQTAEGVYAQLAQYIANLPPHATLLRLGFGAGNDGKTINYLQ